MMRDYLDVVVLANLVSMMRAEIDGAIWLADDDEEARFYERCAHHAARVIPAPHLAVQLLETLIGRGIEGLVASVRGAPRAPRPEVFRPGLGDVASVLLASKECDRVIEDVCGVSWVTATEKMLGPIRNRIVWIARCLEVICRAHIEAGAPTVDAEHLPEFVQWETLEPRWPQLEARLKEHGLPVSTLTLSQSVPHDTPLHAALLDCDGMTAVHLLAAGTRMFRPRGIAANRAIDVTTLMAMLRVAFDLEQLETDEMYWRMKKWERRNGLYPLLKAWRALDPLGVLLDQRYWERDLGCILSVRPAESLAAVKMDLDNFKAVNETLGHSGGDEAIRLYCSIVKEIFAAHGDTYRRGGDEIVVIAPGLSRALAEELSELTRRTVEAKFRAWGEQRGLSAYPTASIGVVVVEGERPIDEVVRLLDEAQGEAKRNGKNRVVMVTA